MNVIIDYKVGNLHNLKNALDFSAVETQLVSAADEVRKADRILLPGVGAFEDGIRDLKHVIQICGDGLVVVVLEK